MVQITSKHISFAAVVFSGFLGSGFGPGLALWVSIVAKTGIGKSVCEAGADTCVAQYLKVANDLQQAQADGKQGDFNGGLLYQFRGGRSVGKWIIGMQAVGWMLLIIPYYGSQNGFDSSTTGLLEPSIALVNSGAIAFKWTIYEFMVFFPPGSVMSCANASYQAGSLLSIIVNYSMKLLGINFFNVCCLELLGVIFIGVIFYLCIPRRVTKKTSSEKKEVENGADEKKNIKENQPFRQACRMLCHHPVAHIYALLAFSTGPLWALVYQSISSKYGTMLFGSEKDGDQLASIVVIYTFISCSILSPILAATVEIFGFPKLCGVVAGMIMLSAILIEYANWLAQHVVAFISVSMWAIEPILLGIHLFAHVSVTLGGAAITNFNAAWMVFYLMALHDEFNYLHYHSRNLNEMQASLRFFTAYGAIMYAGYFLHVCIIGLPDEVVILPEIEKQLCEPFACGSFKDVGSILKFNKSTVIHALTMQAMTHQTQIALINRIDTGALRSQLCKLTTQDLQKLFVTGALFWRKALENNQTNPGEAYVGKIGITVPSGALVKALRNSVDAKKFGKGASKSFSALQQEIADGTSTIFADDSDRLIRETEIVIVRICAQIDGTFYFCIQVGIKYANNTTMETFRFPAVKKQKQETLLAASKRMLAQLGMSDWNISLEFHHDKARVEMLASVAYPGMTTRYMKHFVDATIDTACRNRIFMSQSMMQPNKRFESLHVDPPKSGMEKCLCPCNASVQPETIEVYEWWQQCDIRKSQPKVWKQFETHPMQDIRTWGVAQIQEHLRVKHITARITRQLRKKALKAVKSEMMQGDALILTQALQALPYWVGGQTFSYTDKLMALFRESDIFHHPSSELVCLAREVLLIDLIGCKKNVTNNKSAKTLCLGSSIRFSNISCKNLTVSIKL